MYSYIKGLIVDIQSDHIVLENNGIGYLIYVSNPYAFSTRKRSGCLSLSTSKRRWYFIVWI